MQQHELPSLLILAVNLRKIYERSRAEGETRSVRHWASRHQLNDSQRRSLNRIMLMRHAPTLDSADTIAAKLGYRLHELLTPNFRP